MPFIIIGALIIGLMLGLMGSGGSILTVPVLVYLLGHDGKVAIAESLAIVGGIAVATMFPYARSKMVSWRNVLFFGVPGMAGTYLGAWLSHYVASGLQLVLFAVVMLIAALLMLRKNVEPIVPLVDVTDSDAQMQTNEQLPRKAFWIIGLEGVFVGVITGLVGVGGGFLIVPALVVFGKLPMRVAVGTSLAVIAMKSFSGFYKYLDVLNSLGASIDWPTVGTFVLIGILGSLVGHALATRLNQTVLRKTFAVFLIGMGLFVLGKEGATLLDVSQTTNVTRHAAFHAYVLDQNHDPTNLGTQTLDVNLNRKESKNGKTTIDSNQSVSASLGGRFASCVVEPCHRYGLLIVACAARTSFWPHAVVAGLDQTRLGRCSLLDLHCRGCRDGRSPDHRLASVEGVRWSFDQRPSARHTDCFVETLS